MEDAKRQTLARIVRAGAEEMLPRQLALLEPVSYTHLTLPTT